MDSSKPSSFDRTLIQDNYFRLNVDPSEQYVLAIPGSRKSRLKPGESGFDNLVLAGDWTRSIMDVGCVEGAVISGRFAAGAITKVKPAILQEFPHISQPSQPRVRSICRLGGGISGGLKVPWERILRIPSASA